jgi:hypothetical protein
MAGTTNYERVGSTLELLRDGIKPFAVQELSTALGENWLQEAGKRHNKPNEVQKAFDADAGGDLKVILEVVWNSWNEVFNKILGHSERSIVSELREARNRWAHQESFSTDDAYRIMDSAERLLAAVSAQQAKDVQAAKQKLMREQYAQQVRDERRKAKHLTIQGEPPPHLKPWREVITPHRDVASGNYQQAEFAADLSQVYRGTASAEYGDPREFFRRTYLTEGLDMLLSNAVKRICGNRGEPVMELQTNFGGGKTHSMLALYHLFAGEKPVDLAGVEALAQQLGVSDIPAVRRAVLVGTALSPAQPHQAEDGTTIHTLWGEMAWQLLGKQGYDLVAAADESGVSPGSDVLREVFSRSGGAVILIDEWVAYVRQLYRKQNLCAGSFEANMTFAQALTEAVRSSPKTLLVASIPASTIEIGGEGGEVALEQLKHTFGRMESPWRPASAEESFEIVRRRLFEDIDDPSLFRVRDAVIDGFCEMYGKQAQEFPSECREAEYRRRMETCYPIHPELFDRLYNEWSSLEKFQRTRGILRLMAKVIHSLWESNDASLMIMPCSIPINDPGVQPELVRYLNDVWVPVIERDVDGPSSLPLRLDRENPNMGRYSACRRVARTVYMASAPMEKTAGKGTDDQHIRLGCAQPGESVATFGDALRRLEDQAIYLYAEKNRYWYSTRPSVLSLAKDRAGLLKEDEIHDEIKNRLRAFQKHTAGFARVHACPEAGSDVADELNTRLVILGPEYPFQKNSKDNKALEKANELLTHRGTAPRQYRNTLIFIAAENRLLANLDEAVRFYLAWQSIEHDKGADKLDLSASQARQAETKRNEFDGIVNQRINEAWQIIIAPYQSDPKEPQFQWSTYKPLNGGSLVEKTASRLKREEAMIDKLAGTMLRLELDRIPLWRGNHVEIRQLVEDFAKYIYLPRVQNIQTLLDAVSDGIGLWSWTVDSFAYADYWDDEKKRYAGLRGGQQGVAVTADSQGLLVKPDVAKAQLDAEKPPAHAGQGEGVEEPVAGPVPSPGGQSEPAPETPARPKLTRFYGSCKLDSTRLTSETGKIADEVLQHLNALLGSHVDVTLEIHAHIQEGVPENVVRTVTENSKTLKFDNFGFEEE